MMTITTDDGIEVKAENEKAALKALRKARDAAKAREKVDAVNREQALLAARGNAWRLLDRFVDGDFRNMEFVKAGESCGPSVVIRGICPVLQFQAPNGDCAEVEFFSTVRVEAGIIDGAGWLLAVRIRNSFGSTDEVDWLAVGACQRSAATVALPKAFAFPEKAE